MGKMSEIAGAMDRFQEPAHVNDPAFEDTFSSAQHATMNSLNDCRILLKIARTCLAKDVAGHLDDAWSDIVADVLHEAFPDDKDTGVAWDWFESNYGGIK